MKLMLDDYCYQEKPKDYGTITYRIVRNAVDITPEQLASEIIKGKTFIAGYLIPRNGLIERQNNYWYSQQVICLDFDNTIEDPATRKKIKHVTMTVEEAIKEFQDTAMFIYTTFNHAEDHPKFRVVFALEHETYNSHVYEMIMDYLTSKYPNCDSLKDKARLWFGGKQLFELNYNNRLRYADLGINILIDDPYEEYNELQHEIKKEQKTRKHDSSVANLLKNQDIESLQRIILAQTIADEYIENGKIRDTSETNMFLNVSDVDDYLRRIDLANFLGVKERNSFHCLFHSDKNPSANVFQDTRYGDSGYWFYKCHSCKNYGVLDIISLVEKLSKVNRPKARKLLMRLYNLGFEETEWQKEQKEILDDNIRLLNDEAMLEIAFPNTYKMIRKYVPELIRINLLIRDNILTENFTDSEGNPLFRYSLSQWLEKMKIKKSDNLNRILVLFVMLYLLNKPKDEDIPEHLLLDAKQFAKKHGFNKHTNFYSIPSYSNNVLEKTEEMAFILKESNLKLSAFGRESIERTFGKDVADRLYPQMKDYKFSQMSEDFRNECEKAIFELLVENNGYCTKEQILDRISFDPDKYKHKIPTTNEKLLNKVLPEIMSKYSLTIVKSSKTINEKYNTAGRNRNLIVRKEE